MKSGMRSFWCLASLAALVLCWAPSSFAGSIGLSVDSSVYNNQVAAGIYVSPYPLDVTSQGTSNYAVGTQLTLFCDDFQDQSKVGVPVSFNTTTFGTASTIAGTLWGTLQLYQEGAWLSTQMTSSQLGNYSYAIWAVFDPKAVLTWLQGQGSQGVAICNSVFGNACTSTTAAVGSLLYQAQHQTFTAGEFSNWVIYTPVGCTTASKCASQEFFQPMSMPEGGAALAYLLLTGLTCFGGILYSRRQKAQRALA